MSIRGGVESAAWLFYFAQVFVIRNLAVVQVGYITRFSGLVFTSTS